MLEATENKNFPWFSELIKQLLAYSGILAALSYLFGRSYYQGYFLALGIDLSFIQLSWVEYLESGWIFLWATGMLWVIVLEYGLFVLIVFNFIAPLFDDWAKRNRKFLVLIYLVLYVILIIYMNRNALWIFLLSRSFFEWISLAVLIVVGFMFRKLLNKLFKSWRDALHANPKYAERLDRYLLINDRLLLHTGVLLIFIVTLYFISLGATSFGKIAGSFYLNERANNVELISAIPIISSSISNAHNVYVEDDLRFLFVNDGHYFLSRLDGKCKLQEVFVVDQSNVLSIKITQPLTSQICSQP